MGSAEPPEPSLLHLQLELVRLDILLHRQIGRHQVAIAARNGAGLQRAYCVSDEQAWALLERPLAMGVAPLEDETQYDQALQKAAADVALLEAWARCAAKPLRLVELVTSLGLDPFARDVLLIALAPAVDLRYTTLYAYLQDDITCKWPSVNLILDLLCPSSADRLLGMAHFTPDSPLWQYQILDSAPPMDASPPVWLSQALRPDEGIAAWLLLGRYRPPGHLRPYMVYTPEPAPEVEMLSPAVQAAAHSAAESASVLVFHGIDAAGQRIAADVVARGVGRPLLTLDLAGIVQAGMAPLQAVRILLRDALLTHAIPHVVGWDSCLVDGCGSPDLLAALTVHPGLVIIAGRGDWRPRHVDPGRRLRWLDFPEPDRARREHLMRLYLTRLFAHNGLAAGSLDLGAVAGQFRLTTEQLEDVVHSAADAAAQASEPLQTHHLFAAARTHSAAVLSSLAHKITPRYGWEDLILPDEQLAILHELAATVANRALVLEGWGVGRKLVSGTGVSALFSGPPGTGKTMAAEVIASALGLDLYKIDLSGVVSKYIGETEKNLEGIFREADRGNTILFFDEADALFGKRSEVKDAHDRYANIEISYLLQRMESHNGVAILATNIGANLDEAFTRRLQFRVDFPEPDEARRLRIWQTLFPVEVPRAADVDFTWLARKYNLTGGSIRNVIVAAAYLAVSDARQVTMSHLVHAVRREMQKMGRMFDESGFAAAAGQLGRSRLQ